MVESCTASGANRLADRLRRYWASRGHRIETRIETVFAKESPNSIHAVTLYCVRSDMIGGWPRDAKEKSWRQQMLDNGVTKEQIAEFEKVNGIAAV